MFADLLRRWTDPDKAPFVARSRRRPGLRSLPAIPAIERLEDRLLLSVTSVEPLDELTNVDTGTAHKPQSKTWEYDGQWWSVLANGSGMDLFRLEGDSWTSVLQLADDEYHADVLVDGDVAHILLEDNNDTKLASVQYVPGPVGSYGFWSLRPTLADVPLPSSAETATIDIDSTGRLWTAYDNSGRIEVRYSDGPYETWSGPIVLETNVKSDDIAAITALPNGSIGVLWSNQNDERFGFRTHIDGTDPTLWTSDEIPASQSAKNIGDGMADDHLNLAVAADGTLFAAVKTGYDSSSQTTIGLLVRRPDGSWDDLYHVDSSGTRPIVQISESTDTLLVAYRNTNGSGPIRYRESEISNIVFGSEKTLINKNSPNNISGSKSNPSDEFVFVAGNGSKAYSSRVLSEGSPYPGSTIGPPAPLESGPFLRTAVVDGVSSSTWTTVTLDREYQSMVVVATPNYTETTPAGAVRIRNATGNSFELKMKSAGGGPINGVSVHYMMVEEGVYTEAEHGITMEAVKFQSTRTDRNGSWGGESQTFANTYAAPVVVGQVMTANDADFSVFWSRAASSRKNAPTGTSLKVGKHVGEDSDTTRNDETIGYIVFESGSGAVNGRSYVAALGADAVRGVTTASHTYSLTGLNTTATAIASQAAMDGGDGGWAVLYGSTPVTSTGITLAIDEDQIGDTERAHTTEQVAYIVFEDVPSVANQAPILAAIGDREVNEGEQLTFTASATDEDVPPNELTFSLDARFPTGASIDPQSGVFRWSPTKSQGPGTFDVTVRVTDNGLPALDDFETITVTVNEPPTQTAPEKEESGPFPKSGLARIEATGETDPIDASGDYTDDPAVRVHPLDTSLSLIIGTDKSPNGGLRAYDLDGDELQFIKVGSHSNVDIRYGFALGSEEIDLVTVSNRSENAIDVYKVDAGRRRLVEIGSVDVGLTIYGYGMYHSRQTGKYYGYANSKSGKVEQWEFVDDGSNGIRGILVRQFDVGSQVEGVVADDELGVVYIGEENVGIWKYGAEPTHGTQRTLVDTTGSGGHLTADVEGLTIYYRRDGRGYLIASSQGDSTYAVYRREGDNQYLGSFRIGSGSIDGVSSTDGIDVVNMALGNGSYANGLFVTHDNSNGSSNGNYKLVAWDDIAANSKLGLAIDTSGWNVRADSINADTSETEAIHAASTPAATTTSESMVLQSTSTIEPIVEEAIARWAGIGLDGVALNTISHVDIRISDLDGSLLAVTSDAFVTLDDDAAGWGWFVDSTPEDDFEFLNSDGAASNSAVAGRIDLLTVVMHEFGHVLGLDDHSSPTGSNDLMHGFLSPGQRRDVATARDALFADLSNVDRLLDI